MKTFSITEEDIGLKSKVFDNPKTVFKARGIVLNKSNIAIIKVNNSKSITLPGGSVEENESIEEAFKREILEETGCIVCDVEKIGIVYEYLNHQNIIKETHFYTSKVQEDTKNLNLTTVELADRTELLWCTPKECLDLINSSYSKITSSKLICLQCLQSSNKRDKIILEYYINELQ